MVCRRFASRTPGFEPGLNRGFAIQAKTATLFVKDSPAAQIFPPSSFAPNQRELSGRGKGCRGSGTGLGEAACSRPAGHRTMRSAARGAAGKGKFARDRDQCDRSCPCVGCDEISPIRMTRRRESSLSRQKSRKLGPKTIGSIGLIGRILGSQNETRSE